MTTGFYRGSAEIIQFPVRGRASAGHRQELKPATIVASPQLAAAVFGSSWYHDEAILEDEQARKN